MFDFIDTGRGIQILYEYTKEEILESDFFDLPPAGYLTLLESERQKKWYMLNPTKLNKDYIAGSLAFIVDEHEKNILLRAVRFVKENSVSLPADSSFLERLLYLKGIIPSCFFSSKKNASGNNHNVILLNKSV